MPNPVNLYNFDSSDKKPTMDMSIEHSATNRLCLENLGTRYNFNNEMILYDENILYPYKNYLKQFTILVEVPEDIFYKPELAAYRLYGTTDLWYLVLWMCEIPSALEFNKSVIRVYNPEKMHIINKIINRHRQELALDKASKTEDLKFMPDLTIKPVRIRDIRII